MPHVQLQIERKSVEVYESKLVSKCGQFYTEKFLVTLLGEIFAGIKFRSWDQFFYFAGIYLRGLTLSLLFVEI